MIDFTRAERCARFLNLRARQSGTELVAGARRSVCRGQGQAFAEHREYQYGDDVRHVDWNVTARFGRTFVKVFEEDRSGTLLLVVDLSNSVLLGGSDARRRVIVLEIAVAFTLAASRDNDRIGAVLFTDEIEKCLAPRRSRACSAELIRGLLNARPRGRGTSIARACERARQVLRRPGTVILISDFLDSGYEPALATLAARHDVVAVAVVDPRERRLPEAGLMHVQDPESGATRWIDSSDPRVRRAFDGQWREWDRRRREVAGRCGVPMIDVGLDGKYLSPLLRLFRPNSAVTMGG